MNSSPLAAIWHWYPLLAWVACARFCSLPLGSLSYLNFYLKLRLDSNFSYGTGLNMNEQKNEGNQFMIQRSGTIAPPQHRQLVTNILTWKRSIRRFETGEKRL